MNWLDNFIGFFNPNVGVKRVRNRILIDKFRAYEGATKTKRGTTWNKTTGLSAISEIAQALPDLRNRSRDLIRNNSYASRGIQVIQVNVVGKGIRPAFSHNNDSIERILRETWKQWGETTNCDYDGNNDFYGIQNIVMRSIAESGEVLVRKRRIRRSSGKLSIQLQVLESDFLVSDRVLSNIKTAEGNSIIQGIEFDKKGKIVAYHLYQSHPGNLGISSSVKNLSNFKVIRVPAEEILHIFRIDRPGQARGVPWLAPVMMRLKDFDDYEQAQLLRQKLAACYMAFITDMEGAELDNEEKDLLSKFEPGAIEVLPAGKTVTLSDPPQVNENYAEYTRVMLQAVATGLGVSYEAMTGNLKDINFSSSRMGWLEFQRNIETWRHMLMHLQFNEPAFRWFEEAAELEGVNTNGFTRTWTSPRREMIDPAKEVPALVDAMDAGFKTLSEIVQADGKNPEEHLEALAKEREELDRLGITLQTKNRKNSTDTNSDVASSENGGNVSENASKN